MKLINGTDWSDRYIQRMTEWCCQQVGLPISGVVQATFVKADHRLSGLARHTAKTIEVRIGGPEFYPHEFTYYGVTEWLRDPTEALISITTHELEHLFQWHIGRSDDVKVDEAEAMLTGKRVVKAFQKMRHVLERLWTGPTDVTNVVKYRSELGDDHVIFAVDAPTGILAFVKSNDGSVQIRKLDRSAAAEKRRGP